MKLIITIALLISISCSKKEKTITEISSIQKIKQDSTNHFGADLVLVGEKTVTLDMAISTSNFNKNIRLMGHVIESCSFKGCWMILKDESAQIRVTFKDYEFFVPLGFQNEHVIIEGVLKEEVISEADRKHLAKDGGSSEEDIAKIIGDEKQYTFKASSVLVI